MRQASQQSRDKHRRVANSLQVGLVGFCSLNKYIFRSGFKRRKVSQLKSATSASCALTMCCTRARLQSRTRKIFASGASRSTFSAFTVFFFVSKTLIRAVSCPAYIRYALTSIEKRMRRRRRKRGIRLSAWCAFLSITYARGNRLRNGCVLTLFDQSKNALQVPAHVHIS